MLPLRFPWVWWAIGWLFVIGVVVGSLMPASSIPVALVRDKLVHAGAYGALMLWFAGLYPRHRLWLVALALLVLGLGLDLAQAATTTRSFDPLDVAANTGGILCALVLSWFVFAGWCRRVEQWFFA